MSINKRQNSTCGAVYPWATDFDGSDLACTLHDSAGAHHQTTDAHGDLVSWPARDDQAQDGQPAVRTRKTRSTTR